MVQDIVVDGGQRVASSAPEWVSAFRGWLSSVDVARLSDRERIDLVAELERVKGAAVAAQTRATHALRESREAVAPQDVARSVGSEVALARRESPTLGDRYVGLARALVTEMPQTLLALERGECSERHALVVVQVTSVLSVEHRAEVDRRVGPLLARLGVAGAERAARRVAAELDAAAVVRRMEAAVRSRRVTVRPAPDGMAYLSVLGPLVEVIGAHAALRRRSQAVVGGLCPEELPEGRSAGAVAADTALRLLSGRAHGEVQPVEVHLVMTDRALLGSGDPQRSPFEPARIPGAGSLPASVARAWLRGTATEAASATVPSEPAGRPPSSGPPDAGPPDAGPVTGGPVTADPADADPADAGPADAGPADVGCATAGRATAGPPLGTARDLGSAWLRRLYTSPDGRDLVAMDSRRRTFSGLLRRMLVLRDDVCTTPWCESPIVHADHTHPARDDGDTSFHNGRGRCVRCNYGKEAPGWAVKVGPAVSSSPGGAGRDGATTWEAVTVTTPVGRQYTSTAPPLLGWGTAAPPDRTPRPTAHRPEQARRATAHRPEQAQRATAHRPEQAPRPTGNNLGPHPKEADRERHRRLRAVGTGVQRHRYRRSQDLRQYPGQ